MGTNVVVTVVGVVGEIDVLAVVVVVVVVVGLVGAEVGADVVVELDEELVLLSGKMIGAAGTYGM